MSNLLILDGNLIKDPELKYTQKGRANLTFRVASNYKQGEYKESYFAFCQLWNDAEVWAEKLKKGTRVIIHGRVKTESWEANGQKKSMDKVMVQVVAIASPGKKEGNGNSSGSSSYEGPPPSSGSDDDDFVPEMEDE
jgi:single-strand DNA-binding protein